MQDAFFRKYEDSVKIVLSLLKMIIDRAKLQLSLKIVLNKHQIKERVLSYDHCFSYGNGCCVWHFNEICNEKYT
jgi:hypothetical protein